LERASLTSFPVDGTNIRLDNLTHLTLDSMPIIDSFLILRNTPRLVSCKVSGFFREDREPSVGAPILTTLRSLHLLTASGAKYLLNNLIAPDLEEFIFPTYYYSVEDIAFFFRRSACSLRSFTMVLSTCPDFKSLMSLLQSMPSLNTLSLISIMTEIDIHEEYEEYGLRDILKLLVKIMFAQNTSLHQGFLPNLKILDYTGGLGFYYTDNYEDLYSLPPANNDFRGPLHSVKLDLHLDPEVYLSKNIISFLLDLVERGVTVKALSGTKDFLLSSIDYWVQRELQWKLLSKSQGHSSFS